MIPSYTTVATLAWHQYVNRFDIILYSQLLFGLPVIIIATLIKQWLPLPLNATEVTAYWPNLPMHVLVDYTAAVITILVSVLTIIAMQIALSKQPVTFAVVWKRGLPLYGAAMVITVIELVATLSGLMLLILPGLVISILFSFALVSYVWHRSSPWVAIRHSIQMVRQQFWLIAGYIILTQVVVSLITFVCVISLPDHIVFNMFAVLIANMIASYNVVFQTVLFTMTPGSAQTDLVQ